MTKIDRTEDLERKREKAREKERRKERERARKSERERARVGGANERGGEAGCGGEVVEGGERETEKKSTRGRTCLISFLRKNSLLKIKTKKETTSARARRTYLFFFNEKIYVLQTKHIIIHAHLHAHPPSHPPTHPPT